MIHLEVVVVMVDLYMHQLLRLLVHIYKLCIMKDIFLTGERKPF
jgi:hypothetical protein